MRVAIDLQGAQSSGSRFRGIGRAVRSILTELLYNPPPGCRIEPVYASLEKEGYFYARQFTMQLLDFRQDSLKDEPIDFYSGNIFLGLDLAGSIVSFQ